MVYYYTSGNVKVLRNIVIDHGATDEVSPYEYMKTYIEKCPETVDDTKLSWIAESFLGYHRHLPFLKQIASHLSEELTADDQDYFMIIFHAVTFQCEPKDMMFLYKCLFNLSKPLLKTFTKFLSNNEVLTFISQVAQSRYDTDFITEKIIRPLFEWQPYISDMAHSYAEHVRKIESRKLKLPTEPVQPNVLNRKGKEIMVPPIPSYHIPVTPPNSMLNTRKKRMLTKSTIDHKLKQIHEKNKQKATHLLNEVRNKNLHYAQVKSDKNLKRISMTKDENKVETVKPKTRQNFAMKPSVPVKENTAAVKRINKRIQLEEEEEVLWLQNALKCCNNTVKINELNEFDRQERERERLLDIEKKHLLGQISHEEAAIAKKKFLEENKKKYEDFLKEKEAWNEEIERWKKLEMERNRKQVEKMSMTELNLLQAKNEMVSKKKETAAKIKNETEMILAEAIRVKQEDLERRINMIKEIKILAMIAKKAKVPKITDLTETAGMGLLCEMSLAELQERVNAMKISLKEELEIKKKNIRDQQIAAKQQLEETKISIKNYMSERAMSRKHHEKSKSNLTLVNTSSKEINALKKILEEKRKMRVKLST